MAFVNKNLTLIFPQEGRKCLQVISAQSKPSDQLYTNANKVFNSIRSLKKMEVEIRRTNSEVERGRALISSVKGLFSSDKLTVSDSLKNVDQCCQSEKPDIDKAGFRVLESDLSIVEDASTYPPIRIHHIVVVKKKY